MNTTATIATLVKDIPLNKLKRSPENARKSGAEAGIDEFAASIATHGLLQPLVVNAEVNGDGSETGWYLVTAGERRRKALAVLAKRKLIKKSEPIPCVVRSDGIPSEISLVENTIRTNMHPADQFEAFEKLHRENGLGVEEISARFGVTPAVVKQRLKLAAVSPKLMALYREGGLTLDQLMAFTLTDDHQRQEETWGHLSWNKGPEMIRKLLTESHVNGRDRRVAFVGLASYEAVGGAILRDLFADNHDGWLTDRALLDRLVGEKLEAAAIEVRQEGWKWIDVYPEYPHGQVSAFRRIHPKASALSEEAQTKLDGLTARFDELAATHREDELASLDAEITNLQQQTRVYKTEEKGIAGAIVSLTSEGALRIDRGFVKRVDEPTFPSAPAGAKSESKPENSDEPKGLRPLPDALIADLTAHRTAALQECLAGKPDVALLALTHALALLVFHSRSFDPETCLGVKLDIVNLGTAATGIDESRTGQAMSARHEEWVRLLPDADTLWGWLVAQEEEIRLSLLAYCVARTVNAVRQPGGRKRALAHADLLANAVGLDMAQWWEPTRDSYLARVSKDRILEAVREGVSEKDADDIAGLKKDAMVEHAERLLSGRCWVPEVLRTALEAPALAATST